jgi:hypothetical protein
MRDHGIVAAVLGYFEWCLWLYGGSWRTDYSFPSIFVTVPYSFQAALSYRCLNNEWAYMALFDYSYPMRCYFYTCHSDSFLEHLGVCLASAQNSCAFWIIFGPISEISWLHSIDSDSPSDLTYRYTWSYCQDSLPILTKLDAFLFITSYFCFPELLLGWIVADFISFFALNFYCFNNSWYFVLGLYDCLVLSEVCDSYFLNYWTKSSFDYYVASKFIFEFMLDFTIDTARFTG